MNNVNLYNIGLSNKNGQVDLKLPTLDQDMIFKDNIEELFKLGAGSIHPW